ncbi:MAG: FKBP-type peptidyl-prolyl cis-trans isomerase [Chitinophagales bacterium]
MKSRLLLLAFLLTSISFWSCQPDTSTPKGPCINPSFDDYIKLDLEYRSPDDSILFSTFNKDPLEIKFQESFFKGLLNEGLLKMCVGDSVSFPVDSETLLGKNNPITKKASKINLIIKLHGVKTAEAYKAERMTQQNKQIITDDSLITSYISNNNLTMKKTNSGVYYTIEKSGEKEHPILKNKVVINYNIKLLSDDIVVEYSEEGGKTISLNRLTKGMREVIMLLGKGGKAQALIPSPLAYQNRKRGRIEPNSVLRYEVELLDIKDANSKE